MDEITFWFEKIKKYLIDQRFENYSISHQQVVGTKIRLWKPKNLREKMKKNSKHILVGGAPQGEH